MGVIGKDLELTEMLNELLELREQSRERELHSGKQERELR